jgi:hypothetical protein
MAIRTAEAEWQGSLSQGAGVMRLGSGAFEGRYSFGSRFGDETNFGLHRATNPEELIAAAHAGCFSMALAHELGQAGFAPRHPHECQGLHRAVQRRLQNNRAPSRCGGRGAEDRRGEISRARRSREAKLSRISGTRRDRYHTYCAAHRDLRCASRPSESLSNRLKEREHDHAGPI